MSAWRAAATSRPGLGDESGASGSRRQVGYLVRQPIGYPDAEIRKDLLNYLCREVYYVEDTIVAMVIVGAVMFAPIVATLFLPARSGRTTVTSQDN